MRCFINPAGLSTLPALVNIVVLSFLIYGCGGGGGGDDGDNSDAGDTDSSALTFSVAGVIQAAASNAVDSDVNDPFSPFQANDTLEQAQPIPNPLILGGYANLPGAGPNGRSALSGDQEDWYQVTLAANQIITLSIAGDGVFDDLDLGLFDSEGNLIDAAIGQEKFETLPVTETGDYFLLVQAFQGASNYTLTVGLQHSLPATRGPRLSDTFVPSEVIVRFHNTSPLVKQGLQTHLQAMGLAVQGGQENRNMLLALEETDHINALQQLGNEYAGQAQQRFATADPVLRRKIATLLALKALRMRPEVAYASLNYRRQLSFMPNDELYPLQWHYPLLNLPQAWDLQTGNNTIVAVLDTGVLLDHPDLQGQFVEGYDFISDPDNAGDGDGIDPDPNDPGDNASVSRSSFHGTHVSGTVAAATNNGLGVAGVAFGSRIMPLRVLGRRGATDFDVEQALRFAAGLPNDSNLVPSRQADVINLSLGGPGFSEASQAIYREINAAGVAIVAAAGNSASAEPFFPASYEGVISVSAVDINKELAPYSNVGPFIDVAAPGGNVDFDINGDGKPDGVLSTAASDAGGSINFDYPFYQGTSMASPHMAGVVALMRGINPALTPRDVDNLLASGAITTDLGPPGRDNRFGHGLINAYTAVVAAANTTGGAPITPIPILVVDPGALNFGLNRTRLMLTVTNGGGDTLIVNAPDQDSSGWLTLIPQVDDDGLGSYTIKVNRTGLTDGIYTATITLTSNANTIQVPVIMQVASNLQDGEVGQQFAILIDPTTRETMASVVATRQADGNYAYRFTEVPAGLYEIFAGSDLDNDGLICDSGESCGAYLTLDEPEDIRVTVDQVNLDFGSGFSANLENFQTTSANGEPIQGLSRYPNAPKQLERP